MKYIDYTSNNNNRTLFNSHVNCSVLFERLIFTAAILYFGVWVIYSLINK